MYKRIAVGLVTMLLATSLLAFAGDDLKGFVNDRSGEVLTVHQRTGTDVTVFLSTDTKTFEKRGLFGIHKNVLDNAVLIPGLKVKIKGTKDDQGRFVAKEIVTDGDDIETSQMIEAGLHPTATQVAKNVEAIAANNARLDEHQGLIATNQQNIAANQQNIAANKQQIQSNFEAHTERFNNLIVWEVKDEATVNFAVGKSKLSKEDHEKLLQLAASAKGLTGYVIEVVGYADSTGSEGRNLKLSEDRAKTVSTCLIHHGGIEVRHIMVPGPMGEENPAASNDTKEGRAENRRTVVKVLVNKGLKG